jgi:hypothetical protein
VVTAPWWTTARLGGRDREVARVLVEGQRQGQLAGLAALGDLDSAGHGSARRDALGRELELQPHGCTQIGWSLRGSVRSRRTWRAVTRQP